MGQGVQELSGAGERFEVALGECAQLAREDAHAAGSPSLEERLAATSGGDADDAPVVGIGDAGDETHAFEGADEEGHGGRPDLLGGGQGAEGDGPAEDDDGQRGRTRAAQAHAGVLAADTPQNVNGGRVEAVGDDVGVGALARTRRGGHSKLVILTN